MSKVNNIFQVDYQPEKGEIKINLPEEVWQNISKIILTRLFREELIVEERIKVVEDKEIA